MSSMMDQKIFRSVESDSEKIESRRNLKTRDLPINQRGWETFNETFKHLLDQYTDIKQKTSQPNIDTKSSNLNPDEKNLLSIDLTEIDDDTVVMNDQNHDPLTVSPNSRRSYMMAKEPIESFNEESFNQLPKDAQRILKENHDNIFNSNLTYQEQIEFVIKAIHSPDRTKKTGQTAIGRLFNVTKGAIHSHLTRMNSERRSVVGRPPLLNEEEQQMIIDYVFQCYDENNPPNLFSLIDIIFNKFNVLYSYNTLYKQIQESRQIKTVLAPVYDSTRADVQLDDIKQYYIDLNHIFQQTNVPPSFIINVD